MKESIGVSCRDVIRLTTTRGILPKGVLAIIRYLVSMMSQAYQLGNAMGKTGLTGHLRVNWHQGGRTFSSPQ